MSHPVPTSPPLTPRQRIATLLNGSGRIGSPILSPSLTTNTPNQTSTSAKDGSQTPSHTPLGRRLSRRMSRVSPFKSSDGNLFSSPERRLSTSSSLPPSAIPHLELPATGSDSRSGDIDALEAHTPSTLPGVAPRPTSPSKTPHLQNTSDLSGSSVDASLSSSPPLSPIKRAGAFLFQRSRKDSVPLASANERQGEGGLVNNSLSRPASPTKQPTERPSSPIKRTIDKSMIGLPTNFKHTSGGSSAPLHNAIQLPGLTAVSQSQLGTLPLTPFPSNRARPEASETDKYLTQAHGKTESAVKDDSASAPLPPSPTRQLRRSPSPSSWNRDNKMDTVKELPSGFIQRFENAGHSMPMAGSDLATADQPKTCLSPSSDISNGEANDLRGVGATSSPGKVARTSSVSPTKGPRRKPVPKLEDDPSPPVANGPVQEPDKPLPKKSSCASVRSQEWSATLAEINAALKT